MRLKALGAAGFGAPSADLGAGTSLRAQLLGAIRVASKPAVAAVKDAARDQLPKSGGLNEYVAKERISSSTRLSGRQAGVRIRAQSSTSNWGDGQTQVRHPVFGHRNRKWAETKLPNPGWFTETLQRQQPLVAAQVLVAMKAVQAEVTTRRMGRL
jgi:hypothetical protein